MLLVQAASGLKVPVSSRRTAVRSALSVLALGPAAAAVAADNSGTYGDPLGYAAPPSVPGFQAGAVPAASAPAKDPTAVGPQLAQLLAKSKASYEASAGLTMSPDEEKALVEKLRKKYPGVN